MVLTHLDSLSKWGLPSLVHGHRGLAGLASQCLQYWSCVATTSWRTWELACIGNDSVSSTVTTVPPGKKTRLEEEVRGRAPHRHQIAMVIAFPVLHLCNIVISLTFRMKYKRLNFMPIDYNVHFYSDVETFCLHAVQTEVGSVTCMSLFCILIPKWN